MGPEQSPGSLKAEERGLGEMTVGSQRRTQPSVIGYANVGRGPETRNVGDLRTLEEARKAHRPPTPTPQSLWRGSQHCRDPDLNLGRPVLKSVLHKCEIINLCCFKPLNLWPFVKAANRKLIQQEKELNKSAQHIVVS